MSSSALSIPPSLNGVTHYPAIAIDEKATDLQSILKIIHQYPITAVVVKPFRLGGIDNIYIT
jgi:L-alanine-DL-glutamate epimerase-like enolase superfamily enzyme